MVYKKPPDDLLTKYYVYVCISLVFWFVSFVVSDVILKQAYGNNRCTIAMENGMKEICLISIGTYCSTIGAIVSRGYNQWKRQLKCINNKSTQFSLIPFLVVMLTVNSFGLLSVVIALLTRYDLQLLGR